MFSNSEINEANMLSSLGTRQVRINQTSIPAASLVKIHMPKTNWPAAVARRHRHALRHAYKLMRARFGHQRWWPGETLFEVCVGAILTQNTAWTNVERALARLKAAHVLEPARLFALPESKLADLI